MSAARRTLLEWIGTQESPRVLEIGTRAWDDLPPKHMKDELIAACPSVRWTGVDIMPGDGVDVVADVHKLSENLDLCACDLIIAEYTFEHVARPWVAAAEISKALKPGGLSYIVTHQSFPIHNYPSDYFRFSDEAMKVIFSPELYFEPVVVEYLEACKVVPLTNRCPPRWNFEAPAFLMIAGLYRKTTSIPLYEIGPQLPNADQQQAGNVQVLEGG